MRRRLFAVLVTVAALSSTGVALAAFAQTANVTLTTHTVGQSTGILAAMRASDPTAPGAKPKALASLVITFPAHTTFNLATALVGPCRLTDKQLTTPFGPTCPRKSKVGGGGAVANASPLQQTVKATVTAYVRSPTQILLVLRPSLPGATPIIIHVTASGSRLEILIPRVVLGKARGFPGITAVFVSLTLRIPALGRGPNALVRAGDCTSHRFVVRSRFAYRDHSVRDIRNTSSCT
jgi:hypothetical protein